MDAREMQYQFGIQMNQFGEALQLHSDDIQYWLNKGQLELVKRKYNGFNQERKGFEQSQQRIDDLRSLLIKDYSSETTFNEDAYAPTGFYVDSATIPADNLFIISHRSAIIYNYPTITYETINGKRSPINGKDKIVFNRTSQSDDIYKLLYDPFNTTKAGKPLADINENQINIYTNKSFVVTKVIFNYLKRPRLIHIKNNVSCELAEHLHDEVIQYAVDLFLQNTRELKQRLQRETPVSNQERQEQIEQ